MAEEVAEGLQNPEDIIFALPICNETEQKLTEYGLGKDNSISILPLTMFDINSYRRLQKILCRHILKLGKDSCVNCGGPIRIYENQRICNNCNQLSLIKTQCPGCRYEYDYLNYDVSEEVIQRMENVKEEDFFQWDSLFQYKDIVGMHVKEGKIRTICPCCGHV